MKDGFIPHEEIWKQIEIVNIKLIDVVQIIRV